MSESAATENPGPIIALAARYGVEMDFRRIPELVKKHGLQIGPRTN